MIKGIDKHKIIGIVSDIRLVNGKQKVGKTLKQKRLHMKNKNTKSVKSVKSVKTNSAVKTVKAVKNGPGRPKYQPKFPRSAKWTFGDFCEINGINLETGKGENCTILTLRKFLKRDMLTAAKRSRPNSLVIDTGELGKVDNESGLGRKPTLYSLRSKPVVVATKPAAKSKKTEASVNIGTDSAPEVTTDATAAYEANKAALLAPVTPEPVAVVDTAPTAPVLELVLTDGVKE
jgi:hypothetical protein